MQKITNIICSICTGVSAITIKDIDSLLSIIMTCICLAVTIANFIKTRVDKAKENDGKVTLDEVEDIVNDLNEQLDKHKKK